MSNYIREDEDDLRWNYSSLGFGRIFFSFLFFSCFKVKCYTFDVPTKSIHSYVSDSYRLTLVWQHENMNQKAWDTKKKRRKKPENAIFQRQTIPKKKRFKNPFLLWPIVPMITGIVTDTQNSSIDWHLTTDLYAWQQCLQTFQWRMEPRHKTRTSRLLCTQTPIDPLIVALICIVCVWHTRTIAITIKDEKEEKKIKKEKWECKWLRTVCCAR